MCAIVGILAFDPRQRVDRVRLAHMRDRLTHRGPDDAGIWLGGRVGLGHRRLSIVDLAGGHQPMANEDSSVWVVFNGEIYNHAELRPKLIGRGHVYRTRSDTETILHAYDEYGEAAVDHLEGMFALAIWDRRREKLLLARDRLGIKPLYYSEQAGELVFASEIKALFTNGFAPEFDESVLPEFLANRFVAGGSTFFSEVRALEPGHTLTWSPAAGRVVRRYWSLPSPSAASSDMPLAGGATDLRGRLGHAVRRHLMSDVPLGVFLSGGLDSSALAAVTAGLIDEPLRTFSVGFQEAEGNELPFAREVAKAIGADHHEVVVPPAHYFASLPHLIWQQDQPMAFSSGVPLYFVSRLAQQRQVKVVLTGEGADELFLGYNRYRVTFWNQRLGRVYGAVVPGFARRAAHAGIERLPPKIRRYLTRTFLAVGPERRSQFFDNFSVFPERLAAALLLAGPAPAADPYAFGLRCYTEAEGGELERMCATDLQTYLVELLMKQDRMSMAASIESRVPFLDDQLVAHAAAMPGRMKLRGWQTKAVLRRAVADILPPAILQRPKMGFPVPLARWFRGGYVAAVEEFVLGPRARERGYFRPSAVRRLAAEHLDGGADHSERLWLLLTLEIWLRLFRDREPADDVMRPLWRRLGMRYASGVDQNGRTVAAQYWRPAAHVSNRYGALRAAPGGVRHDARS